MSGVTSIDVSEFTDAVKESRTQFTGTDRAKVSETANVPVARRFPGAGVRTLSVRRMVTRKDGSLVGVTVAATTVWVHSRALRMALEQVGAAPMVEYDERDIELALLRDEVSELRSVLADVHKASGGVA